MLVFEILKVMMKCLKKQWHGGAKIKLERNSMQTQEQKRKLELKKFKERLASEYYTFLSFVRNKNTFAFLCY